MYDDLIDHVGHKFGPDSNELKLTLVHRDAQIRELLMAIQMSGMANKVMPISTYTRIYRIEIFSSWPNYIIIYILRSTS